MLVGVKEPKKTPPNERAERASEGEDTPNVAKDQGKKNRGFVGAERWRGRKVEG